MTRRWALAAALFLTATFGFVVVALGSQAGVFAWGRNADATSDASAGAAASPTPSPRIITEYVVVAATPTADASAPTQPDGGGTPALEGEREGEHEESEHETEHHDDDHHEGDFEEHAEHDD